MHSAAVFAHNTYSLRSIVVLEWLASLDYGSQIVSVHAAAGEDQGSCRQCFYRSFAHLYEGLTYPHGPPKDPYGDCHKSLPIQGMVCSAALLVLTFLALLFVCCAGCVCVCVYVCVCVCVRECMGFSLSTCFNVLPVQKTTQKSVSTICCLGN